jgi:hypothetical protein
MGNAPHKCSVGKRTGTEFCHESRNSLFPKRNSTSYRVGESGNIQEILLRSPCAATLYVSPSPLRERWWNSVIFREALAIDTITVIPLLSAAHFATLPGQPNPRLPTLRRSVIAIVRRPSPKHLQNLVVQSAYLYGHDAGAQIRPCGGFARPGSCG